MPFGDPLINFTNFIEFNYRNSTNSFDQCAYEEIQLRLIYRAKNFKRELFTAIQ